MSEQAAVKITFRQRAGVDRTKLSIWLGNRANCGKTTLEMETNCFHNADIPFATPELSKLFDLTVY